jgi:hypothetical protein
MSAASGSSIARDRLMPGGGCSSHSGGAPLSTLGVAISQSDALLVGLEVFGALGQPFIGESRVNQHTVRGGRVGDTLDEASGCRRC